MDERSDGCWVVSRLTNEQMSHITSFHFLFAISIPNTKRSKIEKKTWQKASWQVGFPIATRCLGHKHVPCLTEAHVLICNFTRSKAHQNRAKPALFHVKSDVFEDTSEQGKIQRTQSQAVAKSFNIPGNLTPYPRPGFRRHSQSIGRKQKVSKTETSKTYCQYSLQT